jgi:16S rRNA A1518/A1519 N6-dimethyltransferase RsmA/KsgA/DIM1 with predicted DNA glycosylase/AP lyase activity
VESAVIRLTPRVTPLVGAESLAGFRTFVQAAFGQRRKQMQRALRTVRGMSAAEAGALLDLADIDPASRPEVISPEGFARLYGLL